MLFFLKYIHAKMLRNRPLNVIFWPSTKRNKEFKIQHRKHRNEKKSVKDYNKDTFTWA